MSDASRRHVTLPALLSFFLRAMPLPLMKPWWKLLLVAAVCGFVGYVTVFVAPRRDMITQRGNSSRALHLAQNIREEDRNFLDDLVQKQNQDDHHDGNPLSAPDQNIGKAGTIVSSPKPVPRAELVINTEIVRRGELVVHNGTTKLKRQTTHLSRIGWGRLKRPPPDYSYPVEKQIYGRIMPFCLSRPRLLRLTR